LLTKGFKTKIDGAEITVTAEIIKSDEDLVTMDYAELVDNPNISEGDKIVGKDGSKWKSGIKYLQTSSEHELATLMQVATDNTKEMLLGMWIENSEFNTVRDFMISRIFQRIDGEPLTQEQINTLSLVANYYSYSMLRQR